MAVSNTNLPISWLLGEPGQKYFRSSITRLDGIEWAKKPSHATVPLIPNEKLLGAGSFLIQRGVVFVILITIWRRMCESSSGYEANMVVEKFYIWQRMGSEGILTWYKQIALLHASLKQ